MVPLRDVRRYWRALVRIDWIFKEFAGRFNGKQSPVQLYWHSFDLPDEQKLDENVFHRVRDREYVGVTVPKRDFCTVRLTL
jgi:hypothetical protein